MQALPTGRAFADAIRKVWKRQQGDVLMRLVLLRLPRFLQSISRYYPGATFTTQGTLDRYDQPMVEIFTPPYQRLVDRGGKQAMRRIAGKLRGKSLAVHKRRPVALPESTWSVFNPRVVDWLKTNVFHFVHTVNETSEELLREALSQGLQKGEGIDEITRRVQGIFNDPYRARMIAQSEASRAVHGGQLLAAKQSGVVRGKEWLASSDACDVCLALAAKGEIPLEQPFDVDHRGGPYAVTDHPPAHPHCQCSFSEVL